MLEKRWPGYGYGVESAEGSRCAWHCARHVGADHRTLLWEVVTHQLSGSGDGGETILSVLLGPFYPYCLTPGSQVLR